MECNNECKEYQEDKVVKGKRDNMSKSKEMSIIIYSCWKNRDMWEIFSKLFEKYWKDCPYEVILVTDEYHQTEKQYVFTKIIEKDATWAQMIKEAIRQAETPYVMLWMDDYLLCDYINNDDIEAQLARIVKYHAANLRLIESPACSGKYKGHENIGCYKRGEAYSLATQVGIWDSEFLCKAVHDEWSAWEFERIASLQKNISKQPILVSLDYVFPYEEGVRKGKWMAAGAKLCQRNGIKLDTKVRPIMSNREMAKIYFQGAVLDWNPTLVVKVQNIINRCKK